MSKTEKKNWIIIPDDGNDDIIIPYYFNKETAEFLEKIVPHEQLTMEYPFDFALRAALMPFALLCFNKEYGGLDQKGYRILGDLLKKENVPGWFFVGSTDLDRELVKTDKRLLMLLFCSWAKTHTALKKENKNIKTRLIS